MTTIRTPSGLNDESPLTASLDALLTEARHHPAVRHPFLSRFASGDFLDNTAALRLYSVEYSGYAAWFPRYLRAVIARLDSSQHRDLLLDNLDEEQGVYGDEDCAELEQAGIDPRSVQGVPHPQLFRRFCHAIGIGNEEISTPTTAAAEWRERFLAFLNSATPAQAVGALGLGTEYIVRPIYEQLVRGIRQIGTLQRSEFVFFELHCLVDDKHQNDLLGIARDLAREAGGLAGLLSGMQTALVLRRQFWDQLYQRALEQERTNEA
ncbi:MAG: TenA family transcriptional regulator [Planctomycetota bacterium]